MTLKKVRETLVKALGEDVNRKVTVGEVLTLFEGKTGGKGESSAVVVDGKVVGKKDALTGLYFPAEAFGKRSQSSDGLNYYTKASQALLNKVRREKEAAKKELDAKLAEGKIDVNTWKKELEKIASMAPSKEEIAEVSKGGFKTPEELIKAVKG